MVRCRWHRWFQRPFLFAAILAAGLQSCSRDDREHLTSASQDDAGSRAPENAEPATSHVGDAAPAIDAARNDAAPPELPLGACAGPPGRTLRTLIVGNSQIYFWDLPWILSELSASGPPSCPRIQAEGFTRGGQNLMRLWLGGDSLGRNLATTIAIGHYDVVVIAESIDLVELPPPQEQFVKYANLIIDAARAAGSMPVLYATPYPDQAEHWGFTEMATPQVALGRERSVRVATGGLAWLRVWNEMPSLDLHHADHSHPGFNGSVISSMVLYAVITRATPIGLTPPVALDCYRGDCVLPITAEESSVFERAAWDEVRANGLQ